MVLYVTCTVICILKRTFKAYKLYHNLYDICYGFATDPRPLTIRDNIDIRVIV